MEKTNLIPHFYTYENLGFEGRFLFVSDAVWRNKDLPRDIQ